MTITGTKKELKTSKDGNGAKASENSSNGAYLEDNLSNSDDSKEGKNGGKENEG